MAKYNAEKRRAYYLKYRERTLRRQKEYDDAHRPQIIARMRIYNRQRAEEKKRQKTKDNENNEM